MSIAFEILDELLAIKLNYKGIRVNIFGIPRFKDYYYGSVKSAAHKLKARGLIEQDNEGWFLTPKGKEFIAEKEEAAKRFLESPFSKDSPKNLLLMFDIPHGQRRLRDWLRCQLQIFGYNMVQKSVWVGPSPLPKEFLDLIKKLEIKDGVKTFKLSKGYRESKV